VAFLCPVMSGFEVARDICLLLLLFVAPVTASLALEGHLASQTLRRFVGLCPCHSLDVLPRGAVARTHRVPILAIPKQGNPWKSLVKLR